MADNGDLNTPVISIITPTLNEEKLLPRFLFQFTSELKLKYNIEVIISDGGSTDNTLSIAEEADKLIHPDPEIPQNIPIGRNAGAKAASGKYLYFINADTMIADIDNFFKLSLNWISIDSIAAITCPVRIIPFEEKLFDKIFHPVFNFYIKTLNLLGTGMGRGECQIVKKEIFDKVGGYNENLFAGEDFDLFKRIKKSGKIKYLENIMVYESPRRYRKFGYPKVVCDWAKNSLSVIFRNRSHSNVWEQVR